MELRADRKFHSFKQDGVIGEERRRSGLCSKDRLLMSFLIVALVGALIGVCVYYTQNYTKDSDIDNTSVSSVDKQSGNKLSTSGAGTTDPGSVTPATSSNGGGTTKSPSQEELLQRIDCVPEAMGDVTKVSRELCYKRGCMYDKTDQVGIAACYFSPDLGYRVLGVSNTVLGFRVDLQKKTATGPFGSDLERAVFDVEMHGNNIIRFTFDDPVFKRYKVPIDLDLPSVQPDEPLYEIQITNNDTFAFKIIRKSTQTVLWDTGVGGLVLSDQFLQISTRLSSTNVFGFGENLHRSFKHDLQFKTWPMFARDQSPSHKENANLYGVHPFYTCMEAGGLSHGVFLLNSNAMDYSFNPLPMLTYRTIGGILDFYMFLGPEPENVVQQYTAVIGRPYMPPYYSLGFQLCRYGYKNVSDMETTLDRTMKYGIPVDIQYADIDHFDQNMDFTVDPVKFATLPEYFRNLQANGMRTVIILDPALISNAQDYEPYDNLTSIKGSILWPDRYYVNQEDQDATGALLGYVWPSGKSVFPDFFNDETQDLWRKLIIKHRDVIPFDGLWIDMNEPANFGTNLEKPWNWPDDVEPWSLKCPVNSLLEDPPYRTMAAYVWDDASTTGRLSDKTICMISRQGNQKEYAHYDVHSLYGRSQAPATLKGAREATGERSFVLSRSTYPGIGLYAGHWLGDNDSQWSDLKASIIGMLEFNLFGIPYIGADICGYWGDATPELCKRWHQLGAFYPFSRNHNQHDARDQDPGYFGADVAEATRVAMETRYWLLPYLYTLFHRSHTDGSTVVRPLFHEYPMSEELYDVDEQFLWGNALMIVPILEMGATEVTYQIPEGRWYDFYSGLAMEGPVTDQKRAVDADSNIGLLVRAGTIIPMQRPANNTAYSRQNPFKLLVSLDNTYTAEGEMFWDDGVSVDTYESGNYFMAQFQVQKNVISMVVEHDNTPALPMLSVDEIQVYGAPPNIQRVYCDGADLNFTYSSEVPTMLTISNLNLPLARDFKIYWATESDDERYHHDCIPESQGRGVKATRELCEQRGCIYQADVSQGPVCYLNLDNYGYKVVGERVETEFGFMYSLQRKGRAGPYHSLGSPDIAMLNFTVEERTNDLLRFKFDDASGGRYQVPIEMKLGSNKATMPRYELIITSEDPFAFQVIRKSNKEILWDTGLGGLTFSEHFLHIATKLPSKNIYGFGENIHHTLRHDLNYRTWPMFARDQPTSWGDNFNHYGVHPFYTVQEDVSKGGHSHGVLLLNSNSQDYSFNPLPMLTYRTIGGILDFYMFLGPEPENVVQQYTAAIGRPYMPPYWSLGFQLCRYGYNSIENLKSAVDMTKAAGIPHDVQYADIDHMDERMDFTVDDVNFDGLNDYFKSLQDQGMHIIIILDPTIISNVSDYEPYEKMRDTNSNIRWPTGGYIPPDSANENNDLLGYVWPKGKVVFPDFFKNSTKQVWKELIVKHHKEQLTFDGLWIDMNEPANFGTNEERPFNWPEDAKPYWSLNCTLAGNYYEHPPYRTMAAYLRDEPNYLRMLSDSTICMRAIQGDSGQYLHYDVHSLYGWSETQPTLDGLREATGQRGIVISRSTFPSSGKATGHWLGDNNSAWKDLRRSIIGSLEFNLFGITYVGADICGFMEETTPELCKRWMQLGAFYTFTRNHNGLDYLRQDPGALGEDVARASRVAMETRYWLLPYLYTLFHHSHTRGNTVMRPLHHEFPDDERTFNIDQQFLWGSALLISPILYQGQTAVNMYVPRGPWYDFYTGSEVSTQGDYVTVAVDGDSDIPLHVRAGHIFPMQQSANNTHFSRQNAFSLLVALRYSGNNGRGHVADGDLYWDDGDTIDTYENGQYYYARFTSGQNSLSMTVEHNNDSSMDGHILNHILVYGVTTNVNYIYIADKQHTAFTYNQETKVLNITDLDIAMDQDFSLEWREWRKATAVEMQRVDCFPDLDNVDVTLALCDQRSCIYNLVADLPAIPACYFNRSGYGYNRISGADQILLNKRHSDRYSMFGNDVIDLSVKIEKHADNMLRIKISDNKKSRYEAPVPLNLAHGNVEDVSALYMVKYTDENSGEFSIQIIRKSTNTTIWDTSAGPLIFSDQYIQLSTRLASDSFYGLGEHRHFNLKHNMEYKTWPIFTRDSAVNSPDFSNLYGAHPFYMNIEDNHGNAHAVLLLNTNAMEVVLEPMPRLTYRTIGGVLDFYFFMGPDPESVIQQYTQVIGTPVMVPYWGLGFQLCRWGYNSLDNLKAAVDRTRAAGIPHDIQYADIDYMDERKDFTIDDVNFAGLPEYVNELKDGGMHFISILDPAIISNETNYWPYETGVEQDVYIMWPNNTGPADARPNSTSDIMLGYVWPKGKVAFPDFLKNETKQWWIDSVDKFHHTLQFDGLWIDMNEPANFETNEVKAWNWPAKDIPYWTLKCTLDNNTLDIPPYKPRAVTGKYLSEKTLCMTGLQQDGQYSHYDVHSLYGWSQTQPTKMALEQATNKRGVVISRSTYPSSGRYAGHWLGDNDSFWTNLHDSIIGIIEFNLFGIPYTGADICGFFAEPSAEMCQRWMQLGAFYTFTRNHNGLDMKDQDPGVFGDHVSYSSKIAMEIRYSLLPYLYTQFYHVHQNGGTVIRSMMHEFPADLRARTVDTQFMWAKAFLIAPVIEQGQTQKDVYFPDARWFDHYTGREMHARSRHVTVDAPRDFIPLFWRGGHIIPTQDPANNTVHSRDNALGLIIVPDDSGMAKGDLFWDDGESIDTIENGEFYYARFKYSLNTISMVIEREHATVTDLVVDNIWVFGVDIEPTTISPSIPFIYYTDTKMLHLQDVDMALSANLTLTWS